MTYRDLLDSDLLWLAMRARQAIVCSKADAKDRAIEIGAQHEILQRHEPGTIMHCLVRQGAYTDAYQMWCDSRDRTGPAL